MPLLPCYLFPNWPFLYYLSLYIWKGGVMNLLGNKELREQCRKDIQTSAKDKGKNTQK